jgi:hypothetical protein
VVQKKGQSAGPYNWNWTWLRNLNHDKEVCKTVLNKFLYVVQLQAGVNDVVKWLPDECNGFSVKGCYELLHSLQNFAAADAEFISAVRRLWVTSVPSKIAVFG